MNRTLITVIASLLFSEVSQSQSAVASTASPAPPIQLSVCRATVSTVARILQLRFVDVGPIAARTVFSTVQVGMRRSDIRDVGTFAPSVRIDHTFRLDIDDFPWTVFRKPGPQMECAVKEVDLVDGSHWLH